jgi:energy-coupling factor transporter ATP-binding protein EcfA2
MSGELDRARLLDAMASIGMSELGDPKTFLMPRAAKRILDPAVVVVLGARGSGKSSLAAFLTGHHKSVESTVARARTHGLPLSYCFDAFCQRGTAHPDASVLDPFVRNADDETLRDFWLQWLDVRLSYMSTEGIAPIDKVLDDAMALGRRDPMHLARLGEPARAQFIAKLDDFEKSNAAGAKPALPHGPIFTAVYDDLDMVGAFEPAVRLRFIRALLGLWTSFSSRYRNLRAKIFLPADLFDLRLFDTLDVSKLMARAERLEWDVPSLYRLVLRQLGAQGDDVREWLESLGVRFVDQGENGWVPDEPTDEATKRWLAATLRSVVAVHGTRSVVQQWIPNRLRDGRDRVAPRSMLGFFSESAKVARGRAPRAHWNHLLAVDDAVSALDAVGSRRVEEVREVYEWVDRLLALKGHVLPLPRADVEALLEADVLDAPRPTRPRDGRTVTTELVRMGMLRELGTGERLDLPDLFVRHFGALRRDPPESAGALASSTPR